MKIMDRQTISPIPAETQRADKAHRSEASLADADKVSLSDQVRDLQQANVEKVAAVRRAIMNGEYKVDLDLLAQAIVVKEQM